MTYAAFSSLNPASSDRNFRRFSCVEHARRHPARRSIPPARAAAIRCAPRRSCRPTGKGIPWHRIGRPRRPWRRWNPCRHNHLVHEVGDRGQAIGQAGLFILDDHAERDARRRGGGGAGRESGRGGPRPGAHRDDPIAGRSLGAPLVAEPGVVLLQLPAAVDPQSGERPAAVVVHEHVKRHQQVEARLAGPDAQVVVVEETQAIALVQAADAVEDLAADQQAEAREPLDPHRPARELAAPPRREGFQPVEGPHVVAGLDLLRRGRRIAHGADQADVRPVVDRPGDQAIEPAFGHDGVVVQQHQVAPRTDRCPGCSRRGSPGWSRCGSPRPDPAPAAQTSSR